MRGRLFVSTATSIAAMVLLSACGSSSKSSASSGSTTSAPASANALTCTTFAGSLELSPPVSATVSEAHKVNVTGNLSGCTGSPGITSGDLTLEVKVTDKLNCAQLISYSKPNTANLSITWNNGTKSTGAEFLVTFQDVTKFLISGKISAGNVFLYKTVTAETANTPEGGGCLTGGASLSVATLALAPGTSLTIG